MRCKTESNCRARLQRETRGGAINAEKWQKCKWLEGKFPMSSIDTRVSFCQHWWRCIPEERRRSCREVEWPRFTFQSNDSTWNCLFIMSQKVCLHFCNSAIEVRTRPSIVALINGHVQSTYCLWLGAERATEGQNIKGQVPYLRKTPPNDVRRRTSQLHPCVNSLTLNTTFCWRTTHCYAGARPHSGSRKADKRPRKTSQQSWAWFDGTLDKLAPETSANRKASQLLSESCGSLGILLALFSPANDRRVWQWWEKCKERAKNTLKILFFFLWVGCVHVWVPRCLSFRMDGQINDWRPGQARRGRLGTIPMGGDGKAALWWKAFKLLSSSAWGLELYKSKMSRRHWSCSALFNETQTRRWGRYHRHSGPAPTSTSLCTRTHSGKDRWQLYRPRLWSLFNCDKLQMVALVGAVLQALSTWSISTWILKS